LLPTEIAGSTNCRHVRVRCFMKHQPYLSLKNTTLARATSLNEKNVKHQKKYKELFVKFKFTDKQICSLDEIGVMIVIQTHCSSTSWPEHESNKLHILSSNRG
jgi:hypothetical protein